MFDSLPCDPAERNRTDPSLVQLQAELATRMAADLRRDKKGLDALAELAAQAQELGLGY